MASQALAGLDAFAGDARGDVATAQEDAAEPVVVALVGVQLGGALAPLAARAADGADGIDAGFQHRAGMGVGRGQRYREGDAASVDHKVALRPRFTAIRRIRPGERAPLLAGTLAESSAARLQSRRSVSPSRSSSAWCSASHTPA